MARSRWVEDFPRRRVDGERHASGLEASRGRGRGSRTPALSAAGVSGRGQRTIPWSGIQAERRTVKFPVDPDEEGRVRPAGRTDPFPVIA